MRRNKLILNIMLLIGLLSCIKEFDPDIKASDERKYVVRGELNDSGEEQIINVSFTSPSESPHYIPVSGCGVRVIDNNGNTFDFQDSGNGNYSAVIEQQYFVPGILFRVEVNTPEGKQIISEYDEYTLCPPVDSVYYIREDIEWNTPGMFTRGIQFYLDMNGSGYESRHFRWEVIETHEYHAMYPREWYYDGEIHHIFPADSSLMVCWLTREVPYIYTLTTSNLSENKYRKLPLHFVDNKTNRLLIGYSILIKQYSLSNEAYVYYDQMRSNSVEQGGLHTRQPIAIQGNLSFEDGTDQQVLGFFSVSSLKTKRIFIQNVEGLPIEVEPVCNPLRLRKGLREIAPYQYPAFLMGDQFGYSLILLDESCVDCRTGGGDTIKPDYWPW